MSPGWWLSPLPGCEANTGMITSPWALSQPPCPTQLVHGRQAPGSFSHLGTLPRLLFTGWAVPWMGSGGPSAPSSSIGSDSRDTGSGAGSRGGDPAARDIHLGVRGQGQVVGTALEGLPTPHELTWPPAHQPLTGTPCVLAAQVPGRDLQKPEPTLSHRRNLYFHP